MVSLLSGKRIKQREPFYPYTPPNGDEFLKTNLRATKFSWDVQNMFLNGLGLFQKDEKERGREMYFRFIVSKIWQQSRVKFPKK